MTVATSRVTRVSGLFVNAVTCESSILAVFSQVPISANGVSLESDFRRNNAELAFQNGARVVKNGLQTALPRFLQFHGVDYQ